MTVPGHSPAGLPRSQLYQYWPLFVVYLPLSGKKKKSLEDVLLLTQVRPDSVFLILQRSPCLSIC